MRAVKDPFGLRHTTLVASRPVSCTHAGSVADRTGDADTTGKFCSHGGGSAIGFAVHAGFCGPGAADTFEGVVATAVAESRAWAGTSAIRTRAERSAVHHAQRERTRKSPTRGSPLCHWRRLMPLGKTTCSP